ncbi:MAG TPA: T9SS type A sorting domain-containing protein [Bacteroidales bacterium]|nr:T9SS type A sorting domain-containing protein [Bacteroidales bacterium]
MRKRFFLIAVFIFSYRVLLADTLTIMQYNLMYYDKVYGDCNATNNNVDAKDGYLRTILNYVKPDVLAVNEVNDAIASVERIKTNTLNYDGETRYKRANFSGSFLVNMIYYNSEKLELKSQEAIPTSPRETNVYKFYLKTPGLVNGDTVFLYHFVTHLKAGNYNSAAQQRAAAANSIMSYISSKNLKGNVIFSGDLNLYSASEDAFVAFTTPVGSNNFRFYDPLNAVGNWHLNYSYRFVHTQSTRTVANEGCFSTGGLDDRFDFILTSSDILAGTSGVKFYSYTTLGQDGNRFNGSIISPTNTSIPTEVANALYSMSDHLPVIMKVTYNSSSTSVKTDKNPVNILFNNPVYNTLKIQVLEYATIVSVNIFNILGNNILSVKPQSFEQKVEIDISGIPSGVLLVQVMLNDGQKKTVKIVKR